MKIHELVEALVVIACGVILLSPQFNVVFHIPFLSFMEHVPHDVISHLAIALVPIIIVYFFDMFKIGRTD
jgi:Ca2+/Na+ antiporter